jgi:hypothetical protein
MPLLADRTRKALTLGFMASVKQSLEKFGVVNQFKALAVKLTGAGLQDKDKVKFVAHLADKTLHRWAVQC